MKVLIVDDQAISRKKLEKIFQGAAQSEAVEGGQAAIDAFKGALNDSAPFDLITLDLIMPDLDGIEVLQAIRYAEKEANIPKEEQVKILMVTSSSSRDAIIACAKSGCDDYIVKPVSRKVLSEKLKKIGLDFLKDEKDGEKEEEKKEEKSIQEMIETTIRGFNEGNIELPVMPKIVKELQEVMSNLDSGLEEVTEVIERDAAISVSLIATANSAHYRGIEPTKSISAAISRLGMKECQSIVNAIANKGFYESKNAHLKQMMFKHWQHSLACANLIKLIITKIFQQDEEQAFMNGLLHDIGSVLLLKSLDEALSKNMRSDFDEDELLDSIYEVHTSFGEALLKRWEFSEDFVKIAKLHEADKFSEESERDLLIVNVADNLAHKIGLGFFNKGEIDLSDLDSIKRLNIDLNQLEEIGEEVKKIVEASKDAF